MKYTIALIYGDPSCDGHGMHETNYYYSNYKTKDIDQALTKVNEQYDISVKDLCSDYGQNTLTEKEHDTLVNVMKLDISRCGEDDEGEFYVYDFPVLILTIAKHILTDLEYEPMEPTKDFYDIGGYGMFEN